MNAKDYEAEWKWMNSSPEAKQLSDATNSSPEFDFDSNRKATGRMRVSRWADGSWENSSLIEDRKYWSQPLKDALGFHQDGGFPAQLIASCTKYTPASASC